MRTAEVTPAVQSEVSVGENSSGPGASPVMISSLTKPWRYDAVIFVLENLKIFVSEALNLYGSTVHMKFSRSSGQTAPSSESNLTKVKKKKMPTYIFCLDVPKTAKQCSQGRYFIVLMIKE